MQAKELFHAYVPLLHAGCSVVTAVATLRGTNDTHADFYRKLYYKHVYRVLRPNHKVLFDSVGRPYTKMSRYTFYMFHYQCRRN